MNYEVFENLKLIPTLLDEIYHLKKSLSKLEDNSLNKTKWLTVNEVVKYIGYSQDSIRKMIKEEIFIEGIHYHKRIKKLIFDKNALDTWIKDKSISNSSNINIDETIKDILSSL